jgi:hypothetical protein
MSMGVQDRGKCKGSSAWASHGELCYGNPEEGPDHTCDIERLRLR